MQHQKTSDESAFSQTLNGGHAKNRGHNRDWWELHFAGGSK
jgi:hypothetical protein